MKKMVFENVVNVRKHIGKFYPRWSDYGCLCYYWEITSIDENGDYVSEVLEGYNGEDLDDGKIDRAVINWASKEQINAYRLNKFNEIAAEYHYFSWWEIEGLEIEIVKGRKYPKGTRFINKFNYKYDIAGTYGHQHVDYLCDNEDWRKRNIKVDAKNCKLVGLGELSLSQFIEIINKPY